MKGARTALNALMLKIYRIGIKLLLYYCTVLSSFEIQLPVQTTMVDAITASAWANEQIPVKVPSILMSIVPYLYVLHNSLRFSSWHNFDFFFFFEQHNFDLIKVYLGTRLPFVLK